MSPSHDSPRPWRLPALGQNPSSTQQGTTPGSFARTPDVGGAFSFSSPDTPGMPQPSDRTAWDFMPESWPPAGFEPVTQLEHARLGFVTPLVVGARRSGIRERLARRVALHDRPSLPSSAPGIGYTSPNRSACPSRRQRT